MPDLLELALLNARSRKMPQGMRKAESGTQTGSQRRIYADVDIGNDANRRGKCIRKRVFRKRKSLICASSAIHD